MITQLIRTRAPAVPEILPLSRLEGRFAVDRDSPLRVAVVLGVAVVVIAVGILAAPVRGPLGLVVLVVGGLAVCLTLSSPLVALTLLVVTSFMRLALQLPGLPAEPMVLVLCALVVALALAIQRGAVTVPFGAVEAAMLAYLAWNVVSAVLPHEYPAEVPGNGEAISVYRFVLTGTVIPFVAYLAGRALLQSEDRVRRLMIALVLPAAYSAVVSILQFTGPASLVWPRYIVTAPSYPERAVGVVNQPLVNGLVMVAGFVMAMFLAQQRALRPGPRLLMLLCAVLCLPGIYLTKTRAAWLVFGVGVILCALFGRGARAGFVAVLAAALLFIGVNWSTFTSSDRTAGGVASAGEVDDRLNSIATSFWAIEQKPLLGWGIGRFAQVNTQHHKQWTPSTDFRRGYAIASHENELGIATELGLIGLALWLAVMLLIARTLVAALRRLPVHGLAGRALGLVSVTVLGTWVVSGFTADLRFFDFANLLTFLLIGATVGVADRCAREVAP
ncbi:O-antigen ligase family protein [Pseudonocardia sp. CA-107938]|uniref:O-antigen ligase family protein n=1 Tax=Pseudonocardia sp. CA-107938 TaxID=3240021 RepID=UPI003D90652B